MDEAPRPSLWERIAGWTALGCIGLGFLLSLSARAAPPGMRLYETSAGLALVIGPVLWMSARAKSRAKRDPEFARKLAQSQARVPEMRRRVWRRAALQIGIAIAGLALLYFYTAFKRAFGGP